MRILMLSPEDVGAAHGGAVHTLAMARAFGNLGHEVMLVAPGDHGFDVGAQPAAPSRSRWAQQAAPLHQDAFISHVQCPMKLFGIASSWRALPLERTLKAFKPDVIYERQLITGGGGSALGPEVGGQGGV